MTSKLFGSRTTEAPVAVVASTPSPRSSAVETFRGDYNIHALHAQVLAYFTTQRQQVEAKQGQRGQLQWIVENGASVGEKRRAMLEVASLDEWLRKHESNHQEQQYRQLAQVLLTEYDSLVQSRKSRVFGEKRVVDEKADKRELVIVKFLALARGYIEVSVMLDTTSEPTCPVCGSPLVETGCKSCPAFIVGFEHDTACRDTDQPKTVVARITGGKRDHIHEAFVKFQGKQSNTLPPVLVEAVLATIQAYGIDRSQLSIDMLYQILRDRKESSYYDDIYLLYHLITKKPLPDLEAIMPQLRHDADEFVAIYHEVKPKNRLNCLNAHFIRDVLLRRHHREYPEWQCSYLRTEAVTEEHNSTMARAFERLGWGKYVPL